MASYQPGSNSGLQATITKPPKKSGSAPDSSARASTDDGGILYKLIDKNDYAKYRVLSDDELYYEATKAKASAKSLIDLSGKLSSSFDTKRQRPKSAGAAVFVPPQMGTTSKARARENRAWEKSSSPRGNSQMNALKLSDENIPESTILAPKWSEEAGDNSRSKISARDAAKYFDSTEFKISEKSIDRRSKSANQERVFQNRNLSRPKSATTSGRLNSTATSTTFIRSRSAGSTGRGTRNFVTEVQADIDRYNQKQIAFKEKEKQEALEKQQYELELRERMLRASKAGSFEKMIERDKADHERYVRRMKEKKQKEDAAVAKAEEARKKLMKDRLNRSAVSNEISWKDLQEQEEAKRRERVEKRKAEVAALSAYPTETLDSVKVTEAKMQELRAKFDKPVPKFRAEDPERVAARLVNQSLMWEEKQQKKSSMSSIREPYKFAAVVKSMEDRQKMYEVKKKQKEEEKRKKENLNLREKLEAERREQQRLVTQHVPESSRKNTEAVLKRLELLERKKKEVEEYERREQRLQRVREAKLRRASLEVSRIVKASERERAAKSNKTIIELKDAEEIARQRAEQDREESRRRYRENQLLYKQAAARRKSLIQRHDDDLARQNAKTEALVKAGTAIINRGSPPRNRGKDSYSERLRNDEILSKDEKYYLSNFDD